MKPLIFGIFVTLVSVCTGLINYDGTELQKCFNCFCHARTGCYSRLNCAKYSINKSYWQTAQRPVVDRDDDPDSDESFRKCMLNENCIYATLDQYANAIGHMNCNCDDQFDCKDRFAIHLMGASCKSPKMPKSYVQRFNTCAQNVGVSLLHEEEGSEDCSPEIF